MALTTKPPLETGGGAAVLHRPLLFRLLSAGAPRILSSRHALESCAAVEIGRGAKTSWTREKEVLRLAVEDESMSSAHARLVRAGTGWAIEDLGSTNGTRRNGEQVSDKEPLADGDLLELGATLFVFRAQLADLASAAADFGGPSLPRERGMRTLIPSLQLAFTELRQLAPTPLALAIEGPTGAGKELVAAAVHQLSGRAGRLVPVNCAALPATLAESELFGYVRGAFSGADRDKEGLIEASSGGTLFLDEVGDLPLAMQALLLRALQERVILRVGDTRPRPIDLRVVCATHRSLEDMVERGEFRDDLRARLVGSSFRLPALAERREDIGLLIASILEDLGRPDIALTQEAARALVNHSWPRNIRELRQALERGAALASDGAISRRHLPEEITSPADAHDVDRRAELVELLREHAGNISAVARAMGKARQQIQRWLSRYEIDAADFR